VTFPYSAVVVQRGGSVEIALAVDLSNISSYAPSIENGVQMAVEAHPVIRGFPIQIRGTTSMTRLQSPAAQIRR
jgi:hypothetical protein